MLKNLLENKNCFKLICGAGNEDVKQIENLVAVYASVGCKFFDISPSDDVFEATKRGIKYANVDEAYICVSVSLKNDLHSNKAIVDYDKCISCFSCDSICPEKAIQYAKIKKNRCIGCGKCVKNCPKKAITLVNEGKNQFEILQNLIDRNVDCIEIHSKDLSETEIFDYINQNYEGLLSVCVNRKYLSDEEMINRLNKIISPRKPFSTIVQADGISLSGCENGYKITLQAVANAQIIQKENLPVYLLLSGGTNSKTKDLLKLCEVDANGVAMGSSARKLVQKYTMCDDLLDDKIKFEKAVELAKTLIL